MRMLFRILLAPRTGCLPTLRAHVRVLVLLLDLVLVPVLEFSSVGECSSARVLECSSCSSARVQVLVVLDCSFSSALVNVLVSRSCCAHARVLVLVPECSRARARALVLECW